MNNTTKLGNFISEYSVRNRAGDDIPVYSVTNKEGFCRDYFSKDVASQDRSTYKIVPRGCFAYNPSRINVGSVDWQRKEDRVIVSPLYVVFSVSKELDQQYLYYYLKSEKCLYYIKELASGSVRDNLKLSMLKEFTIPNITLEEQRKAVTVLEQTDRLITLQERQMTVLDELVKSRFVEMFGDPFHNPFGWKEIKISEVLGGRVSNGYFAKREDYVADGNVAVLGVSNVVNRMYSQCAELPRTNASLADIEKYRLQYGDMLFCRSSLVAEGIGKASIVPRTVQPNTLFECHVIRLPLNLNLCVPEYMQVLTTTEYFRQQILSQAKTATMTTIGQEGILKSLVLLPPLDLQQQFLSFIAEVDKSKLAVKQSLEKLETLKKSLMQQYFG